MPETSDLDRFVRAQDADGAFAAALGELRRGRKTSHWMWYVLPQVAGLGRSGMATRYAVQGLPEARAYLAHPVLGPRLAQCCEALLALPGDDPVAVMGPVDAVKLRSSMTLFARAAGDGEAARYEGVLAKFFDGEPDAATVGLIGA